MIDVTIRIYGDLSPLEQQVLAALGGQTATLDTAVEQTAPAVEEPAADLDEEPQAVERERGKPRPGRKRRTAEEVAEDEAWEAAQNEPADEPAETPEATTEEETPEAEPEQPATEDEAPAADEETEQDEDTGTVEYAVRVASDLLDEGKAGEVKAALKTFNVRRVSELKKSQVADFLAALGR